jgi:hypothetical protein
MTRLLIVAAVAAVAAGPSDASPAKAPTLFKNCTNLNRTYPHGVGRVGARDRTSSGDDPVTTFKRSTALYNKAMSYNRGLDRDKDGVACEKQ